MAVVVSSSQNEIEDFKKKGLDIAKHRKRMVRENLETKFKKPDDPLRIVFVCEGTCRDYRISFAWYTYRNRCTRTRPIGVELSTRILHTRVRGGHSGITESLR